MKALPARRAVNIWLAFGLSAIVLPGCGFGGNGVTPIRTPFNKGVYHYSRGRFDEAIAEFRLALDEDASDHRARFNLAAALEAKARGLAERGDRAAAEPLVAEAEAQYRRILEARPVDLRASVNLAAREFERGDRDGAIER